MSDVTKQSRIQRIRRVLLDTTATLVILAGAAAAVVVGSEFLADQAEASTSTAVADPIPVSVRSLTLEDGFDYARSFTGQVEASATVALSFELGGRLAQLQVSEGETVRRGQLLATLDTSLLEAEHDRLSASREATATRLPPAESRLARARALKDEGFASQETLEQAQAGRDELLARIREIDAALAAVALNLEKSELFAPFDGRVGQRNVDGGETLGAGAPVLTLIETAAPRVRVGLPLSVDVANLESVVISVDGTEFSARLNQIRPDIDPLTRTRTAIFAVDTNHVLTVGQTAALVVQDRIDTAGTWVPLDALQEGPGGVWTILTVADDVVRSASVEIRHAEATRAYVRGTFPAGTQMITAGAHRVVAGQQVRPIATED